MRLFLVRHAIAYERSLKKWPDDSRRPLTRAGTQRFRKAASGLAQLLPRGAVLLTSPFVRARDTARILAKAANLRKPVERAELAAGETADRVFAMLRARKETAVIVVGHEPDLSSFLSIALARDGALLKIEFKKGGAACVSFGGQVAPGGATLEWLLPPRVLRALS